MADKSIFGYDPILGCPFDDSEMRMVENWKGFSVGNTVEFQGLNDIDTTNKPWLRGQVVAIGENAKYLDGAPFVAFAVKVGDVIHFKTQRDIHQTV